MNDNGWILLTIGVFFLSPGAAIIWIWTWHEGALTRAARFALEFTTTSYAFLWLGGILYRPLLGPDYSPPRYFIIELNLAANICLALIVAVRRGWKRPQCCVAGSCGLVALGWLYLLAANSTV